MPWRRRDGAVRLRFRPARPAGRSPRGRCAGVLRPPYRPQGCHLRRPRPRPSLRPRDRGGFDRRSGRISREIPLLAGRHHARGAGHVPFPDGRPSGAPGSLRRGALRGMRGRHGDRPRSSPLGGRSPSAPAHRFAPHRFRARHTQGSGRVRPRFRLPLRGSRAVRRTHGSSRRGSGERVASLPLGFPFLRHLRAGGHLGGSHDGGAAGLHIPGGPPCDRADPLRPPPRALVGLGGSARWELWEGWPRRSDWTSRPARPSSWCWWSSWCSHGRPIGWAGKERHEIGRGAGSAYSKPEDAYPTTVVSPGARMRAEASGTRRARWSAKSFGGSAM